MRLNQVLNESVVKTNLKGETKQEIIEELLDILVDAKSVSNRTLALASLMDRERKMSTGIQHGVAIPHAKTPAVAKLSACIGLKSEGVDFKALDGKPSTIFVMTLSPENLTGPHVQFLAEISMVLKSQKVREQLLTVTEPREVLSIFGAL